MDSAVYYRTLIYHKSSSKYSNATHVLIVLFSVLITDTVSLPLQNDDTVKTVLILLLALILVGVAMLHGYLRINREAAAYFSILCLCCLASQVVNWDLSLSYEYKIALILVGIAICRAISFREYRRIYVNVMCFITLASIFLYLSVMLGFSWWKALPLGHNGENHTMLFAIVRNNVAFQFRLFGPYLEPGVFQAYLNMAVLFMLHDGIVIKKLLLLCLGIILTFSTTGYICLFLLLSTLFFPLRVRVKLWYVVLTLTLLAALALFLYNPKVQAILFEKFLSHSESYSSFQIRLMDIRFCFGEFLKKPLLGTGAVKSFENVVSQYEKTRYSTYKGSVSTTMRELGGFGGVFGLARLALQYKFCKKLSHSVFPFCIIFLVILIFLNTENFIYSLFFNMIFFYGLNCFDEPKTLLRKGCRI